MLQWKIDICDALKTAGYHVTRIRREKVMGIQTYYDIMDGKICSPATLDTICRILECQPGTLLRYVPDEAANNDTMPEA